MRKGDEVHLIEERGTVPGGGIDGPAEKGPQHGSDVSRRLLLANDRIFEVHDWIRTRAGNKHQRHATVLWNRRDPGLNGR
jgi:hypothetical protein